MKVLHFTERHQDCIFRVIAAILHLGNLDFQDGGGKQATIRNAAELTVIAGLLAIDEEKLRRSLLTRRLLVGGDVITQFHSHDQCVEMQQAICKAFYDSLFCFLIDHINQTLQPSQPMQGAQRWIGVLDIFGFENFPVNYWEQLCINLANEKLQQHFINVCLTMDQCEYREEGVDVPSVPFVDNAACLELIEAKRGGIVDMVSEEIKLPKGSDANLLTRMHAAFEAKPDKAGKASGPSSHYQKPKTSKPEFTVRHYAGEVTYQVAGFTDKNKGDTLSEDVYEAMDSSSEPFITQLLYANKPGMSSSASTLALPPTPARKTSTGNSTLRGTSRNQAPTQGSIFRSQLGDLMATLNSTAPHFLKCLKPNAEKVADWFDGVFVGRQLAYLGVKEVVEVRKAGYPMRVKRPDWLRRYRLLKEGGAAVKDEKDEVRALMAHAGVQGEGPQWVNGLTKVLMKAPVQALLEERRERQVSRLIVRLQARYRCRLLRRRYQAIKACHRDLLALLSTPESGLPRVQLDALEALVSRATDLDLPSPTLVRAKQFRHRVAEVQTAIRALVASIKSNDRQLIEEAIGRAKGLGLGEVAELKEAEEWVRRHAEYTQGVEAACKQRNGPELRRWLDWAQKAGVNGPLEEKARALEREIKEEEEVRAQLASLLSGAAGDDALDRLSQWLQRAEALHLKGGDVEQAAVRRDALLKARDARVKEEADKLSVKGQQVEQWKAKLQAALTAKSPDTLSAHLQAVDKAEAEVRDRVQAAAVYTEAVAWKVTVDSLTTDCQAALASRDEPTLTALLARATELGLDRLPALAPLQAEAKELDREREIRALLITAIESRQEDILQTIIQRAEARHQQRGTAVSDDPLLWKAKGVLADLLQDRQLAEQDEATGRPEAEVRTLLSRQQSMQRVEEEAEARREAEEVKGDNGPLRTHATFSSQAYLAPSLSIHLCPLLRSPDDFVKGRWMGKDKLKKSMLTHTKEALPRSLTKLDGLVRVGAPAGEGGETAGVGEGGDLNELALSVFKNVQGWMGDRMYSFPDSLAFDVLCCGVQEEAMRDEVYVQAMKQVRENGKVESVVRGWQLLGLLSECFLPSSAFLPYLYHFLLTTPHRSDPLLLGYISYTLHTLHHSTPTLTPPSLTHITSFRDRLMHTLILPLHFPDGSSLDVEVSPVLNAAAIVARVVRWWGGVDDGSLSIYMMGPGTTCQCIGGDECLLDWPASGCQDGSMYFLLKKRMFVTKELEEEKTVQSLVYHQCVLDACHGVYDLQRAELVEVLSVHRRLVAGGYFALLGKETQAAMNIAQVKPLVFSYWDPAAIAEFERDVAAAIDVQVKGRVVAHPRLVFDLLCKKKEFSAQLFLVQQEERPELPHSLLLAINTYGLCLMNETTRSVISAFKYQHITGWASNSVRFCLRVLISKGKTVQLNFKTQQGKRIVKCVQEYVEFLMKTQKKATASAAPAAVAPAAAVHDGGGMVGKVREEEKENDEGAGATVIKAERFINVV